jgi:glycosyltransferase involved in cell wall biosynthesis
VPEVVSIAPDHASIAAHVRVLQVIPSIAPSRGGPTYVVIHLARALAALGHEVTILATRSDLGEAEERELRGELGEVRLELHPILGSARFELSPGFALALLRRLAETDVAHVHTVFTWPPAVAAALCRARRVPHVIRPAGTLDEACLGLRSTRQKRLAIAAYVRRALVGAGAVHATSALEEHDLRALEPRARIARIELGVELAPAAPPRAGAGPLVVGALGRVHPIKRLEVLLEAIAQSPGVELEVAGAGDPAYVATLRARATALGIDERVRWLDHLAADDKHAFLARCDLLAFPSAHESFGVAVAEAMAAGRAVIVSPGIGLAGEIEAQRAGLVAAAEPAVFARAISTLAADRALRQRLGAAGRALAESRWSWRASAQATDALYRTLVR